MNLSDHTGCLKLFILMGGVIRYFFALKRLLHPEINTVRLENCFVPSSLKKEFTSTNHIAYN